MNNWEFECRLVQIISKMTVFAPFSAPGAKKNWKEGAPIRNNNVARMAISEIENMR